MCSNASLYWRLTSNQPTSFECNISREQLSNLFLSYHLHLSKSPTLLQALIFQHQARHGWHAASWRDCLYTSFQIARDICNTNRYDPLQINSILYFVYQCNRKIACLLSRTCKCTIQSTLDSIALRKQYGLLWTITECRRNLIKVRGCLQIYFSIKGQIIW